MSVNDSPASDSAADDVQVDEVKAGGAQDVGAALEAAREAAGLSIAEVAERLKLTAGLVQAIETNNKQRLPRMVYVRGFVRNYAKLLGIDADPLLAAYVTEPSLPPPDHRVRRGVGAGSLRGLIVVMTGIGLAIVTVLYFLWRGPADETAVAADAEPPPSASEPAAAEETTAGLGDAAEQTAGAPNSEPLEIGLDGATARDALGAEETGADDSDPGVLPTRSAGDGFIDQAAVPGQTQPLDTAQGIAPVPVSAEDSAPEQAVDADRAGDDSAAPNPSDETGLQAGDPATEQQPASDIPPGALLAEPEPSAPTAARDLLRVRRITPLGEDELWFESTADCWVEVHDMEGSLLYQELLQARQSLRLVGSGPFQIRLGYAPGVTLEYNGEKIPLVPHTRDQVASLVLGQ